MAYPERKPIYKAYEDIARAIIEKKLHKDYAQSEIDELNNHLQLGFRAIVTKLINDKFSNKK